MTYKNFDVDVIHADLSELSGVQHWFISLDIVTPDGERRGARYIMPMEQIESWIACFGYEDTPQGRRECLEDILYEGFGVADGEDGLHAITHPDGLFNTDDDDAARAFHKGRIAKARGKGKIRGLKGKSKFRAINFDHNPVHLSSEEADPIEFVCNNVVVDPEFVERKKQRVTRIRGENRRRRPREITAASANQAGSIPAALRHRFEDEES